MINLPKELSELSAQTDKVLCAAESELKQLPSGTLSCEKQSGKYHFIKIDYPNGKRKRKNLNADNPEIVALVRKALLLSELNTLKNNSAVMKSAVKRYKEFDYSKALYLLKQKYPILTDETLSAVIADEKAGAWAKEPYEKYQYQDSNTKWQMSSFGLKLRSKSELLIAEMLHEAGVAFRYEQVLHFGDSMLVPDFTIRREDGKLMYWEHEGLTNSSAYLNRQIKKSQIYAMNNIVPWDNLIVTYDTAEGMIDLRIVRSEIQNKLISL